MKPVVIAVSILALSISPVRATQGGSGKISGIVIQAGTARPIDGVQIILSSQSPIPGQTSTQVGAVTDQFGRFEVKNVQAGRYRVQWTRPGYFTPPLDTGGPDPSIIQSLKAQLGITSLYIASPPAATSVTVDVGSQENLEGFVFSLIPGGVISGRLLDAMGNPLVSTSLSALTLSYEDGVKVLRPGTSTTSDDRGDFRLFGLRPGEYYIRADLRPSAGAPPGEVVRVYFPGVFGLSGSVPILVSESGESPGADFRIPNGGTAKVSGTVTGLPSNTRSNIQFSLLPVGEDHFQDPSTISIFNSASAENRAAGGFELRGVSPGQYVLGAFLFDNVQARSWAGSVMLDIRAPDYQNVAIEMRASTDLKGRLMLEDGSPVRQPISLRPRGDQAALSRNPPPLNSVINTNAEGTFTISQAAQARYSITQNASDSCIVDIRQGGKSVYDDGFVGGIDAEPIDVILSKQCGTVQVQILDDRKQQIPNAFVSLVPAAEHRRNVLLYRRSIFDVAGSKYPPINLIPPGEYKMFAWDSIPPNAELNAEFLSKFEDRGVPVTVQRGGSITVQLPLITAKN